MSPGIPILSEYAAALEAADEAGRRLHAATVRGDVNARERAELDRECAVSEVERIRSDGAALLLTLARWAEQIYPGRLAQVLGVAERVEDIESAVLTLADEIAADRGPYRRAA